jgi:hypothetical protein
MAHSGLPIIVVHLAPVQSMGARCGIDSNAVTLPRQHSSLDKRLNVLILELIHYIQGKRGAAAMENENPSPILEIYSDYI